MQGMFSCSPEFVKDVVEVAIKHGKQVKISYVDRKGNPESRIIEPLEIKGNNIGAFCQLRQAYRYFTIDRVVRIGLYDLDRTFVPEENPEEEGIGA
jgi:predicted DNA-binding transcriptional regulator YafY